MLSKSVGRCPPVPDVRHAVPNTSLATDGSIVTYICGKGYAFEGHLSSLSIACSENRWNVTTPPKCIGNMYMFCVYP